MTKIQITLLPAKWAVSGSLSDFQGRPVLHVLLTLTVATFKVRVPCLSITPLVIPASTEFMSCYLFLLALTLFSKCSRNIYSKERPLAAVFPCEDEYENPCAIVGLLWDTHVNGRSPRKKKHTLSYNWSFLKFPGQFGVCGLRSKCVVSSVTEFFLVVLLGNHGQWREPVLGWRSPGPT